MTDSFWNKTSVCFKSELWNYPKRQAKVNLSIFLPYVKMAQN